MSRLTTEREKEIRDLAWVGTGSGFATQALVDTLAELDMLRAEKESFGNEFNAVIIMKERLDIATTALIKLSKCGGGCEGPMGCMCKGPIARVALNALGIKPT